MDRVERIQNYVSVVLHLRDVYVLVFLKPSLRDRCSSHKIDYVIVILNFLNLEGHQNPISGSKVTDILLKGWILPIGGASAGRVCPAALFLLVPPKLG